MCRENIGPKKNPITTYPIHYFLLNKQHGPISQIKFSLTEARI